jgi:hypothetical protein
MAKILQFRLPSQSVPGNTGFKSPVKRGNPPPPRRKEPVVISAMPDQPFPVGHEDFRSLLQRDGLILMSWARWEDWAANETFEQRYIVTWAASKGKARHYATKPITAAELAAAAPERKADALFYRGAYGDRFDILEYANKFIADYLYLVAPYDLTQATIPGFIQVLKAYGSTADFDREFTLGAARKNEAREYLKKFASTQTANSL